MAEKMAVKKKVATTSSPNKKSKLNSLTRRIQNPFSDFLAFKFTRNMPFTY